MKSKTNLSWLDLLIRTTIPFLLLCPLFTFLLLTLKGLPSFAAGHVPDVILWIYQVTWMPALLSGLLLSLAFIGMRPWLRLFIQPFDIGRCYSLGAITGAQVEAYSTRGYRLVSHRPFSSFWIGGAMMAGSLAGACITLTLLGMMSRDLYKRPLA